jgi:hypothetical protein
MKNVRGLHNLLCYLTYNVYFTRAKQRGKLGEDSLSVGSLALGTQRARQPIFRSLVRHIVEPAGGVDG